MILRGDALDLILAATERFDLVVTDPPYSFSGGGDEHALSATVAIVLRESAKRLKAGSWMIVMCASSWRSIAFTVESLRGELTPIRIGHWGKPKARTKTRTTGWAWASVNVIAFRKGKAEDATPSQYLDHITAAPIRNGRRAELPPEVCDWMVGPFAVPGGTMLDPFAGSGALVAAAERCKMQAIGYEIKPPHERPLVQIERGVDDDEYAN
jgi:DNA modification methylase